MIVSRYTIVQAEEALDFLAKTDDDFADAIANSEYLEYKIKQTEAEKQLASEQRSQEAKKADAKCNPEVIALVEQYRDVVRTRRSLEQKRMQAHTIITWVQSKMKAENQGARL